MEPRSLKLETGDIFASEGETTRRALLIASGRVRITRRLGEADVPISLLGPGEIAVAESLFELGPIEYTVEAMEPTTGFELLPEILTVLDDVPEWLSQVLRDHVAMHRMFGRPESSHVATLYGLCNILFAFMRLVDNGDSENISLRSPLRPIREELRKSRPASRNLVKPVLEGLSQVGLIDLRLGDPLTPILLLPDVQLFLGFLIFLQNAADLKEGLHSNVYVLSPLSLSTEAEVLLDGLLMEEDLAARMFEPERAIVHLTIEQLQHAYESNGGNGGRLDPYHPALKEIENLKGFTRVVDNERMSVFLNLRNLLRLNIRRDPVGNFVDIIDYLLDLMFSTRYQDFSLHGFNEEI